MPPLSPIRVLGAVLWHPAAPGSGGPVAPWLAGVAIGCLALLAALTLPRRPARPDHPAGPFDAWEGPLGGPLRVATRTGTVVLVALAAVAGRVGDPGQLQNIAPALIVGLGWPLAVLACAVLGPAWRWAAPVDSLARTVAPDGEPAADVRPALVSTAAWIWYLAAFDRALDPRSVGLALALYLVATLAGCLAFGRRRFLSSAEVFGLIFGWLGRLRRGGLTSWTPPRGAELVLGALGGGVAFSAFRRSGTWLGWTGAENRTAWAVAGVAVAGAATAAILAWLSRRAEAPGSVAAAAVPAVAGIALAVSLVSYRLTTSAQLVVIRASDPLGRGWDLFGTAGWRLNAQPISHGALATVQLALLAAGVLAGAVVLSRRAAGRARLPGALALTTLGAIGAVAVSSSAV